MPRLVAVRSSALSLVPDDLASVPQHMAEQYEVQADQYWQAFYERNTTNFYKNRHYLDKEFPDLVAGPATLLEVGCGVGNAFWPLVERNPQLHVYACDFAPKAVALIREQPAYAAAAGRVHAFEADLTAHDLVIAGGIAPGSVDLATMVFVLSAIHPNHMAAAVCNVARCLKPGGRLLFRDYAQGDLAQDRLALHGARRLPGTDNFYLRGDGTRCYYFGMEEVAPLFGLAGFRVDDIRVCVREIDNHKRGITMHRRWLQAILTLDPSTGACMPPGCTSLAALLVQRPQSLAAQAHSQHALRPGVGLAGSALGSAAVCCDDAEMEDVQQGQKLQAGHAPVNGNGSGGLRLDTDVSGCVLGRGWLAGAAGRLASHLAAGPGTPSARALLPDSLDSPEELLASLSPAQAAARGAYAAGQPAATRMGQGQGSVQARSSSSVQHGECDAGAVALQGAAACEEDTDMAGSAAPSGRALEAELERQFFETIGRDAQEVVAEEVAAAGHALAGVRLADVTQVVAAAVLSNAQQHAPASPTGYPYAPAAAGPCAGMAVASTSTVTEALNSTVQHVDTQLAPGVAFMLPQVCTPSSAQGHSTCTGPGPGELEAALAVARLILALPALVTGRSILLIGGCSSSSSSSCSGSSSAFNQNAASLGSSLALGAAHGTEHAEEGTLALSAAAMAAVRSGARRVLVTHGSQAGLQSVSNTLKANASRIVVERLKLAPLDWSSPSRMQAHVRELQRSMSRSSSALSALAAAGNSQGAAAQATEQGFFDLVLLPDAINISEALSVMAHSVSQSGPSWAGIGSSTDGLTSGSGSSISSVQALFSAACRLAIQPSGPGPAVAAFLLPAAAAVVEAHGHSAGSDITPCVVEAAVQAGWTVLGGSASGCGPDAGPLHAESAVVLQAQQLFTAATGRPLLALTR